MRMLKQSLLSMVLVLVALFGLNVIRLSRAPAQAGPQGEGPVLIRNGDVDCDGQINITDPIVTLNWLFGDGPEPCAIAQTDTCCTELREEVAGLRGAIEKLSTRIPGPRDILMLSGQFPLPAQGGEGFGYKVPDDKWLIMTSVKFGDARPELISKLDGKRSEIQVPNNQPDVWSSGLPIPPGTELILSYPRPYWNPPAPFSVEFYFHGYLVAE